MPERLAHIRLPISTRLAFWYGLSLLILLSVFVIYLYTSFHVGLHRDFDEQLRRDESRLLEAMRFEGSVPVLDMDGVQRWVAYQTDGPSGTYVRVLSPSGNVLYESPNFRDHGRYEPLLPDVPEHVGVSRTWQAVPARSLYTPVVDVHEELAGWLEVTRLESELHRDLHRLRWLLALGILLGAALAIGSGYALARRALQPVATITRAARRIRAGDLGERLPSDFGVRDELTDLAETLNALLSRLDASFERERRFRADAAHEMFTPLSAIQSEIDVALRRPRDVAYHHEMLARLQSHARRLSTLVEGLLRLSRAEAISRPEDYAADACTAASRILERFRAPADARGIRLAVDPTSHVLAAVDQDDLEAVLENLIDNAIKFTPADGTVTVSLFHEGPEAVLRVVDTGVGFTEEDATRLFDRFYRADTHPIRQTRGSGLGLSIAQAVVEAYGGHISCWSPGRHAGSTFEVRLPLAEPAVTSDGN